MSNMNLRKYYAEQTQKSAQVFASNNGVWAGNDADAFGYATAGEAVSAQVKAKTSLPYKVSVENTTTTAIANVVILGADTYVLESAPAYGNTVGISITYGAPGVTYKTFLFQTQTKPFHVGSLYVQSTTDAQVTTTFTVTTKDANGTQSVIPFSPPIDPYQQKAGILEYQVPFYVDGSTSLTISSVAALTTVIYWFFPAATMSMSAALKTGNVAQGYANPEIVKGLKVS